MEIPQTFVATFDGIPEGPARASAIRAFLVALDGLGDRAPRWGIHLPSEATSSDEFLGVQAGVGARQGFMNIYHPSGRSRWKPGWEKAALEWLHLFGLGYNDN